MFWCLMFSFAVGSDDLSMFILSLFLVSFVSVVIDLVLVLLICGVRLAFYLIRTQGLTLVFILLISTYIFTFFFSYIKSDLEVIDGNCWCLIFKMGIDGV